MGKQSESEKLKVTKAALKRAKAQLKEMRKKAEGVEAIMDKMPKNVRDTVYAATFVGLIYGYKEGVIDLFPSFFFQFGQPAKNPIQDWNIQGQLALNIALGIAGSGSGGSPSAQTHTPSDVLSGVVSGVSETLTGREVDNQYRAAIREIDTEIEEKRAEIRRLRSLKPIIKEKPPTLDEPKKVNPHEDPVTGDYIGP